MGISIGSILASVGADLTGLEAGLKAAQNKMRDASEQLRTVGSFMTRTITDAFTSIAGRAVQMAGQMEGARAAFTTLLGSAQAADSFIRQLYDFAERTPFEFTDLRDASQRMMAFGFSAQDVIPILTTVGDTLSAFGRTGADGLNRAILALGQMRSSGMIMKQDLNQLIALGIPVFDILKEKLHLTSEQIANIGKEHIESSKVVNALLLGMQERFGGSMDAASRTLLGMWSNFKDVVGRILSEFGVTIVETFDLKTKLASAVQWLKDFSDWFRGLDPEVRKAILGVGLFVSAIGPLLTVIGLLKPALAGLQLAFGTLFGPAGLIVMAVAATATLVITHWGEIKDAATQTVNWLNNEWGRFKREHETVAQVVDAVNGAIERSVQGKIVAAGGKLRAFAGAAAYMSRDTRDSVSRLEQRLGYFRTGVDKAFQGASATISNWQREAGIKFAVVKDKVSDVASKTKDQMGKFGGAFEEGARRSKDAIQQHKQELKEWRDAIEKHLQEIKDLYLSDRSVAAGIMADNARAIWEAYRDNLNLDDATKEELKLITPEVLAYREQMKANGRLLVDALTEGIRLSQDSLTAAANAAGESAMQGVADGLELKSSGAFATWKGFVDAIKKNFEDLGITTHSVAAQIAEDFWNGTFSVKKVFEDLGHALYSAIVTTIIESILNVLIQKIIEIYNAMRGNAIGPNGVAGVGLSKPGKPGDGDGGGGGGGGVGFPIKSKSLAPALDEFTRSSGDRAVSIAFSALSQGLSRMVLNFGEYGSQAAKHYLDQLFGPNGALRNVPGFNEIDFPDIFDVIKWFLGNWGDWLPGGGGGPWTPGGPGGWKPGPGGMLGGFGLSSMNGGITVNINGSLMSVRDAAREVESEFARIKGANGRLAFER